MSVFDIKQMQEERGSIYNEMTGMSSEVALQKRSFTPEEDSKWSQLNDRDIELKAKIDTQYKLDNMPKPDSVMQRSVEDAVKSQVRTTGASEYDCDRAIQGWLCRSVGEQVPEECLRSAAKLQMNIQTGTLQTPSRRDQTVGTVGSGGYLVPTAAFGGLERKTLAYGGLESFCKVIRTSQGNPLPWIVNDDTGNSGSIKAELVASTNTSMAFTKPSLSSWRVTSSVFKFSKELLRDSEFNFQELIEDALAERLERKTSALYVNGAGTTEHTGIVTQVTGDSGVVLASATAITYLELLAALHSVDPSYRKNPSCGWVFNDNALMNIKKLVDSAGKPMWAQDLAGGQPDKLLNHSYHVIQEMPSIGTSAVKAIMFGDWSKVIIRRVGNIDIQTAKELYYLEYALGVSANLFSDILLTNTSAIKFVTSKT